MAALGRDFYARPTLTVARELLGKVLISESPEGRAAGRIVEAEAYIGESDPACHAARGRTPRNAIMYGPAGYAYVYFTYGMHFMFNIVTEAEGFPAAVLIRAVEPLEGLALMRQRRGARQLTELCSGPAKLCRAMGIARHLLGSDLCAGPLTIEQARGIPSGAEVECAGSASAGNGLPSPDVCRQGGRGAQPLTDAPHVLWSPRIGISAGADRLWRCYLADNPHLSRGKPGAPASPRSRRRGEAAGDRRTEVVPRPPRRRA
ncbi:MAG: DNA-3-methyladenine glycosylase [Candidatus Tectomicrobia bacterium]|nr:DNA-3-methyladenine glycosylase [Candidatus Tectomicrobia bacterium]